MDLSCGELKESIWVTEEYGFTHVYFELLMTHANKNVQQAVRYVVLEIRREDRTKDQDLRILRAEKVIKDMVLDINTQREGGE